MFEDRVLGTLVTITDLAERHRAQEALLTLNTIVDSVDEANVRASTEKKRAPIGVVSVLREALTSE